MVTTDQWQAGAQRLSGSNWCGVGRIHPPGHPPVCPVSGAPRPPEQLARVSVSAAFIIQLRSPPAPDLQFAKWWTNTHVLKIKTTLKPEFLIKPTRHWTHICLWSMKLSDLRVECMTYEGVCLFAVYKWLHTKNSHQWWVSFETLILCGSIDTRSVSSQIYPAGAGRGDFDNEQRLQVQVQHELRRDQEDPAQEADSGRGIQPARSHENLKTVQNFTNLSFHVSANYLEIILSDPVTHGENRLESHS